MCVFGNILAQKIEARTVVGKTAHMCSESEFKFELLKSNQSETESSEKYTLSPNNSAGTFLFY